MPLLVRVDPHDLVAEVAVLAEDVRVRVVDVVVRVLPRLGGRGGVPVPGLELITGSFIQSHWPCRTLWPISMFSRILAIPSVAAPDSPRHPPARRDQLRAADQRQPPLERDHRADVAGVAVAEVGLDLLVQLVELPADLLDLLGGEPVQRVLGVGALLRTGRARCRSERRSLSWASLLGSWVWSELDLDRSLGGVDAGADDLALLAVDLAVAQVAHPAGAQLADAGVADALAAAVGQVEARLLAATRIGLCRRTRPRSRRLRKLIVPPSPSSPRRARAWAGSAPCAGARIPGLAPSAR